MNYRMRMDTLLNHIIERLGVHHSCTVFENQIADVWPRVGTDQAKRVAVIEKFAKEHGFSVKVIDPGLRVTFKRL
jgi:hypothetical protein